MLSHQNLLSLSLTKALIFLPKKSENIHIRITPMEEVKLSNQKEDDEELFNDTFDEFPFYDCSEFFRQPIESDADASSVTFTSKSSPEISSPVKLCRRRYASSEDSGDSRSLSSSVSFQRNYVNSGAEKFDTLTEIKENEEENECSSRNSEVRDEIELNMTSERVNDDENESLKEENEESTKITYASDINVDDYVEDSSSLRENNNENLNFLILLAGLVIRAIGFQFNLLISFFTFPVWLIYCSYTFVTDPFRVMRQGREYLIRKALRIWGCVLGNVSAFVYERLKEHKSLLKFGLKFGWGLLWSVYVCVVLVGLLVSAFIVGGILIRVVVEEPLRMKEYLNFDYTEKSPVAFVPIIGCPGADWDLGCSEKLEVAKLDGMRVIPRHHKLQVTVSLILPESDYNRNLGIFQVRVDFLATDGKALASSRRPSMLLFKSQPIRLLLTFLKVAPLLTGYTSESQDLNIKFRGFTEGAAPTACLRVVIEQRAQFQIGAGIPEVYSASLTLESEQPLLKRIVWYWRKTLFVWISMTVFMAELLFSLLCCKSIVIPRVKLGENSPSNLSARSGSPSQRKLRA